MSTLLELPRPGSYLVSDRHEFSRDSVLFPPSVTAVAGTVLGVTGVVAKMSIISSAAAAGNVCNDTITAAGSVTFTDAAKDGAYIIRIGTAGATGEFDVMDPNGIIVGHGAVGTAFAGEIGFTITDGSTHAAVGDEFLITVARPAISGEEFFPLNASATDGTQIARAILWQGVPTAFGAATKVTATTRDAEVMSSMLTWPSGATNAQIAEWTTQLAKKNIIVRPSDA
jgi:hypothetical protein